MPTISFTPDRIVMRGDRDPRNGVQHHHRLFASSRLGKNSSKVFKGRYFSQAEIGIFTASLITRTNNDIAGTRTLWSCSCGIILTARSCAWWASPAYSRIPKCPAYPGGVHAGDDLYYQPDRPPGHAPLPENAVQD